MIPATSEPAAAVVCVHGAGAGGWEWNVWSRVLASEGFAVTAPDLQPSAAGLEATTFADYRRQILEACTDQRTSHPAAPLVVVGASLGGLLALSVAKAVRADALVLVNALPPAGVLSRPLGAPHPPRVRWGSERSIASTCRALPDADDAARLYAFTRWRDESGRVLDEARVGVPVEPVRCPTLVLASECDDDIPTAASRALSVRCMADFEMLPRASHAGPLLGTSAAGIAARVASWLHGRLALTAV